MPHLACRSCGRQIYAVEPLESLSGDELRCRRCGAVLGIERRSKAGELPSGGERRRRH
jgi:ribosomal protein L37E